MGFMTAAIVGSSLVGAAASASAGRSQARAAERGADAQVEAARIASESQERIADRQIGLSREVYDDQTQRFAPFLDSGTNALAAYQYEMGLGPRPTVGATGGTEWGGLSMTPGAQFAMREGRDTMEAGAAARGGLNSGATLAGLERLRFGMAQQDRENQLNRLGGMVDMGQGAAGMQASSGNAFAGQANNALGNLGQVQANTAMMSGQAQAQGLMGAANARGAGMMGAANALSGGVNNLLGWQAYQQMANQPNAFRAGGVGGGRLY
jgi:hypothetical protein